jgi:hypothetical protein
MCPRQADTCYLASDWHFCLDRPRRLKSHLLGPSRWKGSYARIINETDVNIPGGGNIWDFLAVVCPHSMNQDINFLKDLLVCVGVFAYNSLNHFLWYPRCFDDALLEFRIFIQALAPCRRNTQQAHLDSGIGFSTLTSISTTPLSSSSLECSPEFRCQLT